MSPSPSTATTSSPASGAGWTREAPEERPVRIPRQPDDRPPGPPGGAAPAETDAGRLAATVERLRRQLAEERAAADGRALVELAKGVLVERLGCGPAEADRQLTGLARQAGLSPLELAADIVNRSAPDHLTRAAREAGGPAVAVRLRAAESGALAAAGDAQRVAGAILAHALAPLGAHAVAVWAAGPDLSLGLAGHAGFLPEETARWHHVPPGVATVAGRALTERRAVWIPALAGSGLPSIGHRQWPGGGRVAVPARTGGRVVGVLEVCWPGRLEPRPPVIRRQIEALAELCAHALEARDPEAGEFPAAREAAPDRAVAELVDLADGLHDPALVLLPHLDSGGALADFRLHHVNGRFLDPAGRPRAALAGGLLLEAYPMTAAESGLFSRIERVWATGEPFRAERMALTALVGQVPLTTTADVSLSRHGGGVLLVWRVQDETARLAALLQHAQRLGRIGGFEENVRTGEITWNNQLFSLYGVPPTAGPIPLERLPAHAHPDDDVAIGRFLRTLLHHRRPASTAFRLRRPDGIVRHIRVVAEPVLDARGQVHSVRGAYQDISAQHWTEVALAATRDRLAHSEQESAEHSRLALQLQHAIMPPTRRPIDAPGLRVAVRYRPAEIEHLVGGDWYDAVVLPSKEILLCVGDVAGHGIGAATDMVVLRNALRGLATTGAGPAQLLSWLNLVAHHLTDHVTATAVCALYEPRTRLLRWARAGHLPPVLIRERESTTLPLLDGLLLGALAETAYEEGQVQLEPGDTLLMFTDGLIERRDRSVQQSLGRLLTTAQAATGDLERRLDHVLTHSNADTDDDTCLVGIHLR
ncbi:SpoIIE family protein phosphatase [Streptomyces sp. URMC 129]|uniref:SpoIIE family protein phosphatase n=1 Tax=Streptomyces sp. URMC 129 TaxID=3423407 RepID=UPI003F1A1385